MERQRQSQSVMTTSEEVLSRVQELVAESAIAGPETERLISVLHAQIYWPLIERSQTPKKNLAEIHTPTAHKVRAAAPGTSWAAAWSQTPEKSRKYYRVIYALLVARGPMTDYELRDAMQRASFDFSWSGASARRNDLVHAGWVRATGEKRATPNGAPATVWEAVPEEVS